MIGETAVFAGVMYHGLAGSGLAAPQDCRAVENDLDRLACYDRKTRRVPVSTTIQGDSAWDVSVETSAMTDQTNVFLTLQSEETVKCTWASGPVTLILRCRENTTSVIFGTSCHMVSSAYNDYGDVTFRIDDLPAKPVGFEESTNNKALGLWSGGTAIPFAKALFGHDNFSSG